MNNSPVAAHRPPAMDRLLDRPAMRALQATHGRHSALGAARAALETWRASGLPFDVAAFEAAVDSSLQAQAQPALRPVFNLTGTVLHTNLGRGDGP